MTAIAALLALTLVQAQAGDLASQGSGVTSLAGRVVRIDYPTAPVPQLPAEVKSWPGFKYATSEVRDWPNVFNSPGDWKLIGDRLAALGDSKPAVIWRTKVIVVTDADVISEDANKLLRQDRSRLDPARLNETLTSLVRFVGWVRAETNGRLGLSLDVTIDDEPMYRSAPDFQNGFLQDYAGPRFNGGKYEADDKVYRGPYNSVVVVHAGLTKGWATTWVNQTPCSEIPFFSQWTGADGTAATGLEPALMESLLDAIRMREAKLGMALPDPKAEVGSLVQGIPSLRAFAETDDWADLASFDDLPLDHLARLLKRPAQTSAQPWDSTTDAYRLAPFAPNVVLSVETDPDKGQVLHYEEKGSIRLGGFALPTGQVDLTKTPWLKFAAKSGGRDLLALYVSDGQTTKEFPLDGFVPDGKWHEIAIDLGSKGVTTWKAAYLAPPQAVERHEKVEPSALQWDFADFRFEAQGQAGAPYVDDAVRRALAAPTLTAEELRQDSSDRVKLNGLLRHQGAYQATDEADLIALAHEVNPRIAEAAIVQLEKLGTPTAKAEVLRLVTASPFETTKRAAALAVGAQGDPRTAGVLSYLFTGRMRATRMAGAKAISMLPGEEAGVILMTFLQETDPEARLAVTREANVSNPTVVKRFLWSAVNDPSDAVRAESCLRLIFSGNATAAAEGYKGVRDDSVGVRLAILKGLIEKPDEAHRATLRIAVADISPEVRAAALRAFATLKTVSLDEISNTLDDKHPVVQSALIQLAKAKNLDLPKSAKDNLRSSIDPHVAEMAKELGD